MFVRPTIDRARRLAASPSRSHRRARRSPRGSARRRSQARPPARCCPSAGPGCRRAASARPPGRDPGGRGRCARPRRGAASQPGRDAPPERFARAPRCARGSRRRAQPGDRRPDRAPPAARRDSPTGEKRLRPVAIRPSPSSSRTFGTRKAVPRWARAHSATATSGSSARRRRRRPQKGVASSNPWAVGSTPSVSRASRAATWLEDLLQIPRQRLGLARRRAASRASVGEA